MAESIPTKRCSACQQFKPISNFYKNRAQQDGFANQCKLCSTHSSRKYRQSPKGQIHVARARQRLGHKAAKKRYAYGPKNKRQQKRYAQSDKGKASRRKYLTANKQKSWARSLISDMVRAQLLPHITSCKCVHCGVQAHHYHHHNGYENSHAADVVPVCIKCHWGVLQPCVSSS